MWLRLGVSLVWLLLVLYPDPRVLWRSAANALRPRVDPAAVREFASSLPDDPALIERAVLDQIKYAIPWQKDGVPWTFPRPAETMARGYGDCQGRALVLASVLTAKGIPYQLRASLDHMWVDYRGKRANGLENDAKTLWSRGGASQPAAPQAQPRAPSTPATAFSFRLPQIDVAESLRIEREYFWDAAPLGWKLLLFLGLASMWLWPRRPRLGDDSSEGRSAQREGAHRGLKPTGFAMAAGGHPRAALTDPPELLYGGMLRLPPTPAWESTSTHLCSSCTLTRCDLVTADGCSQTVRRRQP